MKTPDEIKEGLEWCAVIKRCSDACPYRVRGDNYCSTRLMEDVLTYIQRLESRLAQVERERDVAVADLKLRIEERAGNCELCAHWEDGYTPLPPHCKYANDDNCWQWRGVCPENYSKEETK